MTNVSPTLTHIRLVQLPLYSIKHNQKPFQLFSCELKNVLVFLRAMKLFSNQYFSFIYFDVLMSCLAVLVPYDPIWCSVDGHLSIKTIAASEKI